jgi:hypothetical protein
MNCEYNGWAAPGVVRRTAATYRNREYLVIGRACTKTPVARLSLAQDLIELLPYHVYYHQTITIFISPPARILIAGDQDDSTALSAPAP